MTDEEKYVTCSGHRKGTTIDNINHVFATAISSSIAIIMYAKYFENLNNTIISFIGLFSIVFIIYFIIFAIMSIFIHGKYDS